MNGGAHSVTADGSAEAGGREAQRGLRLVVGTLGWARVVCAQQGVQGEATESDALVIPS